MSTLKSTIEDLASDFATSIIAALRGASIDELTGVSTFARGVRSARAARTVPSAAAVPDAGRKRTRGGRLGRRTTADIGRMVDEIVTLLQNTPTGLRAEQIRESLGVQAKELPRPLADGLADGRISKTGQKRATTYFAGGKASGEGPSKKRGRGRPKKRAS